MSEILSERYEVRMLGSEGRLVIEEDRWVALVALSGARGKLWVEEYRREELREARAWIELALDLLRRRLVESGREWLDRAKSRLPSLVITGCPSLLHVMDRRYLSALAYLQYCLDEHDLADRSLELALDSIVKAIEVCPFLVPLAEHAYDFRLQKARIARNRRRWRDVRLHLEAGQAMVDSRIPLCTLGNGASIYMLDVLEFYRSLSPKSEEEAQARNTLLDRTRRIQNFQAFSQSIYLLPGFVVPYS